MNGITEAGLFLVSLAAISRKFQKQISKIFACGVPGDLGGEVFRNLNVGVVDPKLDDCAPLHKDLIGEAGTGSQVSYWDRPDCQPIATVHHRFAVAIYGNIVETHAGNS